MMPTLLVVGLIDGSLHAAPVTMLALPASYAVLRRRSALKVWRLALVGGVAGDRVDPAVHRRPRKRIAAAGSTGFFTASPSRAWRRWRRLGSFAGAVAGACFACLTRWLRPAAWSQASPNHEGFDLCGNRMICSDFTAIRSWSSDGSGGQSCAAIWSKLGDAAAGRAAAGRVCARMHGCHEAAGVGSVNAAIRVSRAASGIRVPIGS